MYIKDLYTSFKKLPELRFNDILHFKTCCRKVNI